ncbi:MAG: hypothetical protein U0892_18410 [Pirellulales bacterium]
MSLASRLVRALHAALTTIVVWAVLSTSLVSSQASGAYQPPSETPAGPTDPAQPPEVVPKSESPSTESTVPAQPQDPAEPKAQTELQDPTEPNDPSQPNANGDTNQAVALPATAASPAPMGTKAAYGQPQTVAMPFSATPAPVRPAGVDQGRLRTSRDFDEELKIVYERVGTSALVGGELLVSVSTTGKPSRRDRHLKITYHESNAGGEGSKSMSVSKELLLPEGAVSVTDRIPYTTNTANEYFCGWDVSVFEDGRDIELEKSQAGASIIDYGGGQIYHSGKVEHHAAMLVLTSGKISTDLILRDITRDWDGANGAARVFDTANSLALASFSIKASSNRVYTEVPLQLAPSDWLYYAGFNAVVLDAQHLDEWKAEPSDQSRALLRYVMSGGNVIFIGPNMDAVQNRIDEWLKREPWQSSSLIREKTEAEQQWMSGAMGWKYDRMSRYMLGTVSIVGDFPEQRARQRSAFAASVAAANENGINSSQVTYNGMNAPVQSQLVAPYQMMFLTTKTLPERIVTSADANWHWRNLIPTVGKPPLWVFCGLVLLFGCILGPGLLIVTGVARRRSLLIFFVPAVSLLATFVIVAFSILHEGFGTTMRIQSLVIVDDDHDEAIAWSRQTYFSGLPPRAGLKFEPGTYVRPVEYDNEPNYRMEAPRSARQLNKELTPDAIYLRNWLQARQQQQLMVGHRMTESAPITMEKNDAGEIVVHNKSAHPILSLLLTDRARQFYAVNRVEPGSSAQAMPLEAGTVGSRMAVQRRQFHPTMPEDLVYSYSTSYRWRSINTVDNNQEMLESAWLTFFGDEASFPAGYYAAITEGHHGIQIPLSGDVTESKQMVIGRVRW